MTDPTPTGNWRWPALALVLLLAAAVALTLLQRPTAAPPAPPEQPGEHDFVLQTADGPLDTRSLRGKLALIYFGYTYCPDICPTSLTATAQALEALGPEELARVKVVFVSVDPERDTPARLKEYAAFFHPGMIGATGSAEEIAAVARRYGVLYLRQDPGSSAGYAVDHSTWTYVLGPDGRLAGRIAHGTPAPQVAAEIRKWLSAASSTSTPVPKGTS